MIFIIPQNGNLCWLPGNCSQSSYSLPVKKGALPIEIKIIMSISCASTQILLLNGFLQGWLLDGQMCEWYPPPSSTEMVWDFCRSPLCQTEPQQISPIHHHQHFTGLWTQYCILNSRHVRKLNSTLISFHLYFMFYSLIFAMYVLGLDIPKKHHMLEKQILEMQTVWKRRPLERHTVSLHNQLSVPKLWSP